MIKDILVSLPIETSSNAAVEYAVSVAKIFDAVIARGCFVLEISVMALGCFITGAATLWVTFALLPM